MKRNIVDGCLRTLTMRTQQFFHPKKKIRAATYDQKSYLASVVNNFFGHFSLSYYPLHPSILKKETEMYKKVFQNKTMRLFSFLNLLISWFMWYIIFFHLLTSSNWRVIYVSLLLLQQTLQPTDLWWILWLIAFFSKHV